MTDRELERKLADAVRHTAPDDLDAILSRCGAQNGSVMELKALETGQSIIDVDVTEVRPRRRLRTWAAAACAALALLGAAGGGLVYQNSYAVASVVSLDVNPSIELKVSRNEKVISCAALNEEAAAVLFSMDGGADLEGTKLEVAVNAIVGALAREGYLNSVSSAILISVEDKDQDRAARLQAELVASVDSVLQGQAPNTSVLSQVLDAPEPEYMSFRSGLSAGKAALVRKVMEMNGTLAASGTDAFDRLAALSVEELSALLKLGEKRIPIGKSDAAMAALVYSGTAVLSSVTTDVDPELDDVPPHYDVELKTARGEFAYAVDAFTGEVLSGQKDIFNPQPSAPAAPDPVPDPAPAPAAPDPAPDPAPAPQQPAVTPPPAAPPSADGQDVGRDAAVLASLAHAGLTHSQITGLEVERDWKDGRLEYEIEFWCGNSEYEYTIHGQTCAVLEHEVDHHISHGSGHHSNSHH